MLRIEESGRSIQCDDLTVSGEELTKIGLRGIGWKSTNKNTACDGDVTGTRLGGHNVHDGA